MKNAIRCACEEGWGQDCVKACSGKGACIMYCEQRERQCAASCIDSHNAEVARCPQRK